MQLFLELVANYCSGNVKAIDRCRLCRSGRVAMRPVPEQARAGSAIRVTGRNRLVSKGLDCGSGRRRAQGTANPLHAWADWLPIPVRCDTDTSHRHPSGGGASLARRTAVSWRLILDPADSGVRVRCSTSSVSDIRDWYETRCLPILQGPAPCTGPGRSSGGSGRTRLCRAPRPVPSRKPEAPVIPSGPRTSTRW